MIQKLKAAIASLFGTACLCLLAAGANAQELNAWLDGGAQGLSYKVQNGQRDPLFGGSFGLGFTFPIKSHWALVTGLSGGSYNTRATLNDGTYASNQVDNAGSAFNYRITTTGYKETQRFFSFGIPLLLQYHTSGSRTQWYINGGGKLLMPLNATIKATAKQLALSAYYPDFNVDIADLPQHGFGTVQDWQGTMTYKLKTGAALDAETGVSFALSSHLRLYTGLYLEYGLTDMKTNDGVSSLVPYNPNGIAGVQESTVFNLPNTGSVKLLSYGLMIKLGFSHASHKPAGRSLSRATNQQPALLTDTARTKPQATSGQPATAPDTAQTKSVRDEARGTQKQDSASIPRQISQPAITPEEIQTVQEQVVFGILGKTSIPEGVKPHLDEVAAILNKYPDVRILIIGHTCDIGSEQLNLKIGEERAQAIEKYLQGKGIDPQRMDIRSTGESDPVVPNNSPGNRSRNRRVTILYVSASPN